MKVFFYCSFLLFLASCGTYNYYTLPVNNQLFANAFESQTAKTYGSGRPVVQTGFSVTKNFSILGMYGGSAGLDYYHSKEGETGIGFCTDRSKHTGMFGASIGYGLGNNFRQRSEENT